MVRGPKAIKRRESLLRKSLRPTDCVKTVAWVIPRVNNQRIEFISLWMLRLELNPESQAKNSRNSNGGVYVNASYIGGNDMQHTVNPQLQDYSAN